MMGKRKRETAEEQAQAANREAPKVVKSAPTNTNGVTVQIVTGSYERVLHGITATIQDSALEDTSSPSPPDAVRFADTFLFNAHASAIRNIALTPLPKTDTAQSQKVILASGGTDERVNLYNLSLSAPVTDEKLPPIPTLGGHEIVESSKNRELGSLLHHSASITALHFPSRSKLLSAAEDNTIAVTRTKDWTVVTTIKVPHPKIQGRPSGDTAPYGGAPSGVNDFAIHPSMKLMVSVGKGEKCMRLWNLVTGKKAGVLNFGKDILQGVGEGKWGSGEGKKIRWNGRGDQYAVAFERGAIVFGLDSQPTCKIIPTPRTKIHQIRYLSNSLSLDKDEELLAVSTEDGRVIFYSTKQLNEDAMDASLSIPNAIAKWQLGGTAIGGSDRVKDFEILSVPATKSSRKTFLLIAGCSNGDVQIWRLFRNALQKASMDTASEKVATNGQPSQQIGKLLGTYETGNRITCLASFIMTEPVVDDDDELSADLDGSQAEGTDEESSTSE